MEQISVFSLQRKTGYAIIKAQVIGCPPHPVTCILTNVQYNTGAIMWINLLLLFQLLFNPLLLTNSPRRVSHAESGYDVVNAVNNYRALYGLAPYEIDESLTSIAQAQSDYQASINKNTHTRPDGSGAEIVSSENIAMGYGQSIDVILRQQWLNDYWHTVTLIGFKTGRAGGGVATGSDGTVYYTLDVNNTGGPLTGLTVNALPVSTSTGATSTGGGTTVSIPTVQPVSALVISTPQADGSIMHTIQYGQTLSGIATAYGIPLDDLISLNKLNPTQIINSGQHLIVHPSSTPAPTPTATATALPPTETPQPTATLTPAPSETPTPKPFSFLTAPQINKMNSVQVSALVLGVLCLIGLALVIISRLLKRKK
jgi:uncharacterized protein YkwD/LysM repeat protein